MWSQISAITAVLSLAFAVFVFLYSHVIKRLEETKAKALAKSVDSIRLVALSALEVSNLIVQRAKDDNITVAELQNLARSVRTQLHIVASALEQDEKIISRWKYGKALDSFVDIRGVEDPRPIAPKTDQ
jgi:hypothetical protein